MAWIESHTVLSRHRKVLQLAESLSLNTVQMVGHLTILWHNILEQQEDGDLSSWSDTMIARAAMYDGDATLFVTELQAKKWLDGKLVHDWLDYTGRYLTNKYRTANPKKLKVIYRLHQVNLKSVSSQTKARLKSAHLPNQPDLTRPNQPDLTGEGKSDAVPLTRKPVRKIETEWPEGFTFNERHKAIADGLGLNVHTEFVKFRDKAQSKGWTYKDWEAGFRTWLNNAVEFKQARAAR